MVDPAFDTMRERTKAELALMNDLEPLLKRRAGHREISGLKVYEARAEYGATKTLNEESSDG